MRQVTNPTIGLTLATVGAVVLGPVGLMVLLELPGSAAGGLLGLVVGYAAAGTLSSIKPFLRRANSSVSDIRARYDQAAAD